MGSRKENDLGGKEVDTDSYLGSRLLVSHGKVDGSTAPEAKQMAHQQ